MSLFIVLAGIACAVLFSPVIGAGIAIVGAIAAVVEVLS